MQTRQGRWRLGLVSLLAVFGTAIAFEPPPGEVRVSWVANSFAGDQGENGRGRWVQNSADEIEVSPEGTVLAATHWDEAGRCLGLYRDGAPNLELVKLPSGLDGSAWGWGTGSGAFGLSGDRIVLANTGGQLVSFRWKPGDLESVQFERATPLEGKPEGLSVRNDEAALALGDRIEVREVASLRLLRTIPVGAQDVAFDARGRIWVIIGGEVRRLTAIGTPDRVIVGPRASALSFDPKGRLFVCDNGPAQQVLIYDVSGRAPQLVRRFGLAGGLRAGTPGMHRADKLFGLRGAGADTAGNLYVACAFGGGPSGNLVLRSYTPRGELRWERYSLAFVDTFTFDPGSDGTEIYGRTCRMRLDLAQTAPGTEQKLVSFTLDPLAPEDGRHEAGRTVIMRRLQGRRLLFGIGQYAGGVELYAFGNRGDLAHPAGGVKWDDRWAWDVDASGTIWQGDADGKIRRFRFRGWDDEQKPIYDFDRPEESDAPPGWDRITRILYDVPRDRLILTGYLEGQTVESWGLVGQTARAYRGWLHGDRKMIWSQPALPRDGDGVFANGACTPKSVAVAGDYLFFGMARLTQNKQVVHIYSAQEGTFVGTLVPDEGVGPLGWIDMPYGVQAFRRKNGEYLVLVEEDFRGKNLLYRWMPTGPESRSRTGRQADR